MSLTKSINSVKLALLSVIIVSALQLMQIFIITKNLSPDSYGSFIKFTIIFSFISIFSDLGISSAFFKENGRTINIYNKARIYSIFISILSINLYIIFTELDNYVNIFFIEIDAILHYLLINFLSVYFSLNYLTNMYFSNIGLDAKLSLYDIFSSFIFVFGSIFMSIFYDSEISILLPYLFSIIFKVHFIQIDSYKNKISTELKDDETNHINYGLPYIIEKMTNYASSNIDKFIINLFFGSLFLGLYAAQQQLSMRFFQIVSQVVARTTPGLLDNRYELRDSKDAFFEMRYILFLISFPFVLFLCLNWEIIVTQVLSKQYAEHGLVFIAGMIIAQCYILESHFGIFLLRSVGPKLGAKLNIASLLLISGALLLAVTGSKDIELFAFAYAAFELLVRLPMHQYIRTKIWNTKFFDGYLSLLTAAFWVAAIFVTISSLSQLLVPSGHWWALAWSFMALLCSYFLVFMKIRRYLP